jgi:hypothetical protein
MGRSYNAWIYKGARWVIGLIVAPAWLLALLQQELSSWIWPCDYVVLAEPEKYDPALRRRCFLESDNLISCDSWPKTRFDRHIDWQHKTPPHCGVALREWAKYEATGALTTCCQQAWYQWHGVAYDSSWAPERALPWVRLLSQQKWLYARSIPLLTLQPLSHILEFKRPLYADKKWFYQSRCYDFIVTWGHDDNIPLQEGWTRRPIFWDGGRVATQWQGGHQRRFLRLALKSIGPLWHSEQGLFRAPLFWPLSLPLIEEQWGALQSLLYTYKLHMS